jgi:hypothetical protein
MRAFLLPLAWIVSTVVLSNTVRAEAEPPHQEHVQQHLEFLTKRLDLTPDQQTLVASILRQEADEAAPIYAQPNVTPEHREIARVRKQAEERISPILSTEQREKLTKTPRVKYLD